jgi:hypothetical protein
MIVDSTSFIEKAEPQKLEYKAPETPYKNKADALEEGM